MTANARTGMKKRCAPKALQHITLREVHVDRIARDPIHDTTTKAFYVTFLAHFTVDGERKDIQNQLTWLQLLPDLATKHSDDALVLALQATATAYGAIMSSNASMTKHAAELYGTALRAHHILLQKSGSKHNITIHAVSTSVLLSFFEAMQATTTDAYRVHIYGAAKLLEITGPGECAYGVLCQLFYHVRTQIVFIQLASSHHSPPMSTKEILYDTLLYKNPPLIQRLMCCIVKLNVLGAATSNAIGQDGMAFPSLRLQVDHLWNEYSQQRGDNTKQHDAIMGSDSFSDGYMALTMAYFGSAKILLAIRGPNIVDPADSEHNFQLILDAATYLDTHHNAIAFMRMATPLVLVALYAQCHEQYQGAINIFEIWLKSGMRGISTLALDAVSRQAGEAHNVRGYNMFPGFYERR
ncbi:hypothetical protein C7974DRAFT_299602 [Boeremia exigua]|uniref:uncharacterized protein n=1 Tax=Boeremia exigua TaxID=749465 RepID=UPI001E8D6EC4|nr:uncharacterized protein C7974DRAFT_299602 [Boeremia exigua]KAH6644373.1 hypothetical protein C7974DRAFT_299602 [Boeremia exigua]